MREKVSARSLNGEDILEGNRPLTAAEVWGVLGFSFRGEPPTVHDLWKHTAGLASCAEAMSSSGIWKYATCVAQEGMSLPEMKLG